MTAATFTLDGPVVVCPPDAPEDVWAAERNNGLGGSDIGAACGINTYTSPFKLWCQKTGRPVPDFSEKSQRAMRWGRLLEPVLRDEFQWEHPEYVVTPTPGTLAVPGALWQRVNVDGLVWTRDGELVGVLECKVGSHFQLKHWEGDDEVPVSYTAQVQWAMHVTGARVAFVVGLLDSHTYLEKIIVRDDDLITDLIAMGREFWAYVETDTAPPIDGSDATRETLARIRQRDGSAIDLDPTEWAYKLARHHDLHAQIKALEASKAVLGNELRAAMGEHTIARLNGEKVATHKTIQLRRSTDFDRLQAGWPDAYAACVTEPDNEDGPVRRLDYSRSKAALAAIEVANTTTTPSTTPVRTTTP